MESSSARSPENDGTPVINALHNGVAQVRAVKRTAQAAFEGE